MLDKLVRYSLRSYLTLVMSLNGRNRNTIDKFYTSSKIVDLCMSHIKKYITVSSNDQIIEPSAGNGAFINHIKSLTTNYKFYDIEPEHPEIIKQDFLTVPYHEILVSLRSAAIGAKTPNLITKNLLDKADPLMSHVSSASLTLAELDSTLPSVASHFSSASLTLAELDSTLPSVASHFSSSLVATNSMSKSIDCQNTDLALDYETSTKIHIIGNPPFGRQSSTAKKFIKFAGKFSHSISFILPKSFKKDSMKSCFPPLFHLIFELDLPENSFLLGDNTYNVPCIFQIWVKNIIPRMLPQKLEPIGYLFVKIDESPDISLRRVGVNAGTISRDINKSISSHYFIKFTNDNELTDNIQKLSNIVYSHNNTVGPRSISKPEIISIFNRILNEI